MRIPLVSFSLFALLASVPGCESATSQPPLDAETLINRAKEEVDEAFIPIVESFANYNDFAAAIVTCDSVELYEGLPHQMWESESLAREIASNETIEIGGFPFYASPLKLKLRDAKALKNLYGQTSLFVPYRGPKKCGGYHPDWCIVWKSSDMTHKVELCFGCKEMKTSAGSDWLHCDVTDMKRFERVLKRYRKSRPVDE